MQIDSEQLICFGASQKAPGVKATLFFPWTTLVL